jgi:SAM-dependent methyltransferase
VTIGPERGAAAGPDAGDRAFEAPDLIEVMEEAVRYNRFLIEELASWGRDARHLLDFGAGNGRFCVALLERGHAMHAVEPDARLRERIGGRGVDARESLEGFAPEQRFDGIYSINVLEHIEDDAGLLRAFRDRLRPGGRLLLYVPAFPLLFSANDRRVGHLRRYRREGLVSLVRAAGFELERADYVDCLGFPAGLAYRFFGDRDGGLNVGAVRLYDRVLFPVSRLLDRALSRWLGKNLLVTARRPDSG